MACVWKLCNKFIENKGLAKLAGVGVLLDLWNVGGWRNLGVDRRGGGEPRLANAAGFIWLKWPRTPKFSQAGVGGIRGVVRYFRALAGRGICNSDRQDKFYVTFQGDLF